MDTIRGLYNPNGRLNVENGLNTKLTGCDRPGRGIGAMPTAAMLNGTPPTEIFPTDLEKGMGRLEGERGGEVERGTKEGGAFRCIQ